MAAALAGCRMALVVSDYKDEGNTLPNASNTNRYTGMKNNSVHFFLKMYIIIKIIPVERALEIL